MIEKFYPCEYVKSVSDIEFKKLYDSGIKAVIFDIDNTLVFQDEDSTEETERLFFCFAVSAQNLCIILQSSRFISRTSRVCDSIIEQRTGLSSGQTQKLSAFLLILIPPSW